MTSSLTFLVSGIEPSESLPVTGSQPLTITVGSGVNAISKGRSTDMTLAILELLIPDRKPSRKLSGLNTAILSSRSSVILTPI